MIMNLSKRLVVVKMTMINLYTLFVQVYTLYYNDIPYHCHTKKINNYASVRMRSEAYGCHFVCVPSASAFSVDFGHR